MRGAGIETTAPIIGNGRIQRAYVVGDKRGTKNLSYLLHVDGIPNGFFEHFKTGSRQYWKADKPIAPPTPAEKAEFERRKRDREKLQAQKYEQAAVVARELWQEGANVTNEYKHPYAVKKGITGKYARILAGDLLIALWNDNRELSTLQFIDASGAKRFLTGGKKSECFAVIGKHHAPHDRILICEGYATGESLHDDTGNFVVCAMDAGNLEPVAKVIRRLFENAPITIAGDNDPVGIKAAKAAALACNGAYLIPPVEGTDWNDVISGGGSE
jgi:putative DNA primase/helicase